MQAPPLGAIDKTGEGEAARKHRRRAHMGRQGADVLGQGAVAGGCIDLAPARRCVVVDRRIEVVAEGGAQRRLEAGIDGHRIDHRRVAGGRVGGKDGGKRRGFGLKLGERMFGRRQLLARAVAGIARRRHALIGRSRRGFRAARAGLGRLRRLPSLGERVCRSTRGVQRGQLAAHRLDLAAKPRRPLGGLAHRALILATQRRDLGVLAGELGELLLALADGGLGRTPPAGGGRLAFAHRRIGGFQFLLFLVQPRDDGSVVGDHTLLAADIIGKLGEAAIELGEAIPDAPLLGIERFCGERDALRGGRGTRGGVAEVRQARAGFRLCAAGFRLLAGALIGLGRGRGERGLGFAERLACGQRPQMQHGRLGLTDGAGEVAVAHRLTRLPLQPVELLLDFADHVVEAGEVLLGALQAQLRLVPAIVQSGDACRFFQKRTAVNRLGGDELADLALADDRRRMGTGRGVGKQELYVAGAHVAPVDAIDRPGLALDTAGDLKRIGIVEGRRRHMVGIVDGQRHLGGVARRAVAAALEDDVVHARGAHRLVRAFAHHPAQRLDQIGFAAPVRPDNAGEPRLDREFGRFDERLEPEDTQSRELQTPTPVFRRRLPGTTRRGVPV